MLKKTLSLIIVLCIANSFLNAQQQVIPLYQGVAPGSEEWSWNEAENDHNAWNTEVVYNVSKPTLTVFTPDAATANGTAIIICPGGGFYGLSINSEGFDVAKWLVKKGVTCFVLKYRLAHTEGNDPTKAAAATSENAEAREQQQKVIPLAIADGRAAIAYVRAHASTFAVNPDKIGIIGFSAGGTVAASSAFQYTKENKPDFVAPIYAYMPTNLMGDVAEDAPPMFIVAASNDQLSLQHHSIDLFNKWNSAKHSVELHLYAEGGHGFGMRVQHLTSDTWIERFGDWLNARGYLKK